MLMNLRLESGVMTQGFFEENYFSKNFSGAWDYLMMHKFGTVIF